MKRAQLYKKDLGHLHVMNEMLSGCETGFIGGLSINRISPFTAEPSIFHHFIAKTPRSNNANTHFFEGTVPGYCSCSLKLPAFYPV